MHQCRKPEIETMFISSWKLITRTFKNTYTVYSRVSLTTMNINKISNSDDDDYTMHDTTCVQNITCIN